LTKRLFGAALLWIGWASGRPGTVAPTVVLCNYELRITSYKNICKQKMPAKENLQASKSFKIQNSKFNISSMALAVDEQ
jgi:hypothetical protein